MIIILMMIHGLSHKFGVASRSAPSRVSSRGLRRTVTNKGTSDSEGCELRVVANWEAGGGQHLYGALFFFIFP